MTEQKQIRIVHLTRSFYPVKDGIGGVARKQAEIGSKYGYHISVCTPNYSKIDEFEEIGNKIGIYRIKPFLRYHKAGFINIKEHIKTCDILHIHYPFHLSIVVAMLFAKKYKKKILVFWHMNPQNRGLKGLLLKIYERIVLPWILKHTDKVLVSTKDYFSTLNYKKIFEKYEHKIEELPFSVDTNIFKPTPKDKELIEEYNLQKKRCLLFVGELSGSYYFKGVDLLLNTFLKLNQNKYKLLIVGNGDLKESYKSLAKKLNISDNVIFLNKMKTRELVDYYNLSDVLILSSINQNESFGVVQIEAMACAKPVIAPNLPGVRTVTKDQKTGFIYKTGNIDDLKEKIEQLFIDKEKYKTMCHNARNRVVEKYIDAFVFQKLNKIYENLLDK